MGEGQCLYLSLNPQPGDGRPVLDTEEAMTNRMDKALDLGHFSSISICLST